LGTTEPGRVRRASGAGVGGVGGVGGVDGLAAGFAETVVATGGAGALAGVDAAVLARGSGPDFGCGTWRTVAGRGSGSGFCAGGGTAIRVVASWRGCGRAWRAGFLSGSGGVGGGAAAVSTPLGGGLVRLFRRGLEATLSPPASFGVGDNSARRSDSSASAALVGVPFAEGARVSFVSTSGGLSRLSMLSPSEG
jgi:hypothetical protein